MADFEHTTGREDSGRQPSRRRRKRRSRGRLILNVVGTLLLVALTTCALLACFAAVYVKTVIMPMTPLDLDNFQAGLNSVLYYEDENGNAHELRTLHGDENRIWVKFDDIPKDLINATIAIEDQRFWTHPGVDWKRTAAAVVYMFTGKDIQGGSTITQQLIKNRTSFSTSAALPSLSASRAARNLAKRSSVLWKFTMVSWSVWAG